MVIKEDTVEPSVPAREFNLKAYAAMLYFLNHIEPAVWQPLTMLE